MKYIRLTKSPIELTTYTVGLETDQWHLYICPVISKSKSRIEILYPIDWLNDFDCIMIPNDPRIYEEIKE